MVNYVLWIMVLHESFMELHQSITEFHKYA